MNRALGLLYPRTIVAMLATVARTQWTGRRVAAGIGTGSALSGCARVRRQVGGTAPARPQCWYAAIRSRRSAQVQFRPVPRCDDCRRWRPHPDAGPHRRAHAHHVRDASPGGGAHGRHGFVNVAATKAANDMLRGFTEHSRSGGSRIRTEARHRRRPRAGPADLAVRRVHLANAAATATSACRTTCLRARATLHSASASERPPSLMTPDAVRLRTREQLALGASQVKLMAGGGVASNYDPLDVTQYTVPELRAAVEAAENWGTYVTVHAYTPRAVRQAIEAGVRCIDHGQLLDDATATADGREGRVVELAAVSRRSTLGIPRGLGKLAKKQLEMFNGTDTALCPAPGSTSSRRAWGTDTLFDANVAATQGDAACQDGALVHASRRC